MALKGNIETFYLSSILQLLCGDKKTGVLTIAEGDRRVSVFLKNGTIVHAAGTQKEVRLGYLLRTKGIISAEELEGALALARQRQERLGKILVEKGYISAETLKRFIHQQVREILYDLFLWKRGEFEYVDKDVAVDEEFAADFNHMEIILEGSRRVDEWALLSKHIPHREVVFRVGRSVGQRKESINLSANEWRILSLVDGRRTVQQIIADSGHDEFSVYRIMNSLISSGLIEQFGAAPPPAPAERDKESVALLHLFHDVFQNLRKLLEQAAGPTAANLVQQAKGQVPPGVLGAMQRYDFTEDAPANVRQVLLQGTVDSAPPGRDRLIVAGNALILAILHTAKDALDTQATSAFVQDFLDLLAQWQKRPGTTQVQTLILTTLGQTVKQFEQEILKAGGTKEKGGGILSFLKRH
ncbi:MAG TPA: DUF4388 domain-containing protein [Syntrophobacteria bacterium]|nr:DUF4388 domain-containing protein [Syntrophobacteria bacterium]